MNKLGATNMMEQANIFEYLITNHAENKKTEAAMNATDRVNVAEVNEICEADDKQLNDILTVAVSTPIALGAYKRERITFNTVEEKEEYLSTLDIFSRRTSRTGNLEYIVLNVDLWK